jgi:hypothetical protein
VFGQRSLLSPGKTDNTQLKSTIEESYHALPWMPYEGSISFSQSGRTVSLTNTCNIDILLQIFFMLFKTDHSIREFLTMLHEFEVKNDGNMLLFLGTWKGQTGV